MTDLDVPSTTWVLVLGSWGLAGACVGTSVGITLQLTQGWAGAGGSVGIGGMLVGGVLGAGALIWERSRAGHRPELVDGRGDTSRPLHGLVLGVPVLLAVPALAWLVVVGTVAMATPIPAVTFGMAALGVAWGGTRVWSGHRLARALEVLERGQVPAATVALKAIAAQRLLSRRARSTARLNLGMLALNAGDGQEALTWVSGLRGGSLGAWSAVVRAQAHLLRGQGIGAAEAALTEASTGPGARSVQAQADAVRVLVVWRREGPEGARELAERLHGPAATPLHSALLAALRRHAGDLQGDAALQGPDVRSLLESGLGRAIPELR